jgi:guanine deaminase
MFDVMESFVRQNRKAGVKGATRVKALYRATLAGAEILGLSRITGNFKVGKEANFMVVPVSERVLAGRNAEEILERLHAGVKRRSDFDSLVVSAWIKGRCGSRARSPDPAEA